MVSVPHRIRSAMQTTAAVFAAVCLCGTAAAASPAAAAEGTPDAVEILLSMDGVNFSTDLDGGLFDGLGVLVPTGELAATLWIRNPTDTDADLRVSTRDVAVPPGDFSDNVTMSVWDSGTGLTRSDNLRNAAACGIVVPVQTVGPGATVQVAVVFALADVAHTVNQGDSAELDLLVSMRESAGSAYPASACGDSGSEVAVVGGSEARPAVSAGGLADTGVRGVGILWPIGGALLGVGLYLVAGRVRAGTP